MNTKSTEKQTIDWMITLVPFFLILVLCIFFFCFPDSSNAVLTSIRTFLGDSFSVYYLLIGIGCVVISLYLSFSKYGDIVLGDKGAKPKYSFWAWGSMMFTAGLAADIVFYSFCEWVLYWDDPHTLELGRNMDWASTFTLFHWGPTVWSFYLVLAVAFGFMLHVKADTAEVFGSLSAYPRKIYRRTRRTTHRSSRGFRTARRDRDDLLCRNTTSFRSHPRHHRCRH